MSIDPPKIDKRDFQTLLEQAKQLAPFYVPEWDISNENDSGVALLRIFFHMLLEVTRRLNEVPRKNFIAFLDMLGVKQIPSQPARVPLTFQLTEGAPDVLIPELTQAEAPTTEEREALVFETEKSITATTAALTDIYSVVPEKDKIFDHSGYLANDEVFGLFTNDNQQEHALYLGHEDLFNITGRAQIQLAVAAHQTNHRSSATAGITTLAVEPVSQAVLSDSIVTVNIVAENVNRLIGFTLTVEFDPALLQILKVERASFADWRPRPRIIKDADQWLATVIDEQEGIVVLAISSTRSGGVTGTGNIASLTFKALRGGKAELMLKDVSFTNAAGEDMTPDLCPGEVLIAEQSTIPGQLLNKDLVSWQYYGKEAKIEDGQKTGNAKWYDFSDFGNESTIEEIIEIRERPGWEIKPKGASQGTETDVIIFGEGFNMESEVVLSGDGITITSKEFISDCRLRMQIVVSPDAEPGLRDFTITSRNGDILARRNLEIAGGIYPEIGYQGELDLHIRYFSNFQNVDENTISITPSDNSIKITENSIKLISDFQLEFFASIASDAICGRKLIEISLMTKDGQSAKGTAKFLVAERPQCDISPERAFQDDAVGVDLFGIFIYGVRSDVSVECDEDISIINVDCISQSRLHLQIAIGCNAPPGERTIRALGREWRFYIDERIQERADPGIVYQGEVVGVRINEGIFGVNSEVEFIGAGILVNGAELVSMSQLLVRMEVDNNALQGTRDAFIKTPGIILLKEDEREIIPCHINGIDSRWIRCFLKKTFAEDRESLGNLQINAIKFMSLFSDDNEAEADLILSNDVPLTNPSPGAPVYPFGKQPRLYNGFYIASQEFFSKKDATIDLHIESSRNMLLENVKGIDRDSIGKLKAAKIETIEQLLQYTAKQLNSILITTHTHVEQSAAVVTRAAEKYLRDNTPTLSWEYWNGSGWQAISDLEDTTISLSIDGTVTFTCPKDIAPTSVSGQENYWIRARIVGGDYGKEKFIPEDISGTVVGDETWKIDTSDITPPRLHRLSIKYTMKSSSYLQHCLTHNNLEFQDVTRKSKTGSDTFQPFLPIPDNHQTVYLGFDKPFPSSNVSFFFSLEEQLYPEENRPRLLWYYYAQRGEWARLGIVDDTESLTRSGTVELIGPSDFAPIYRFGKERYWLKAVDTEDSFNSDDAATGVSSYSQNPQVFHVPFSAVRDFVPAPRVKGVYLNSTWAAQASTIQDEILGSSSGRQFQVFQFAQTPALDETVQVDERGSISEEEKETIIESEGKKAISEVSDISGEVSEIWVQWKRVNDFLNSTSSSRHYVINPISGEMQFGDGMRGKIPPGGQNNIRATYRTGGGRAGNVGAAEVQDIISSIAFVDSVNNPYTAGGGSDAETLDEALERGPQALRNRGRAVTAEDYEWLAKEASPDIARAKCLPNFNNVGAWEPGWVTLIIVPESKEVKPTPSPMLRRKVTEYLREKCSGMVAYTSLQVVGPAYIRVSINAEIYPASINLASDAEENAREALKAFLHPLTGGESGTGWEFGRMVHFSDLYALLEAIEEIDHVGDLTIRLEGNGQSKEYGSEDTVGAIPDYALIYSGEHEFTLRLPTE